MTAADPILLCLKDIPGEPSEIDGSNEMEHALESNLQA
jgi:hypothetical protein